MEATARFTDLMQRPDADIALDEAAALIAAHAHPSLEIETVLASLDQLASDTKAADADSVAQFLFVERGFVGNTDDYGDPRNSYLDEVLARRLGIPISLAVLMMEVGRRLDVPVQGVSMPGHFLVRPADDAAVWFDPFHGGSRLDEADCRALFARVRGPDAEFRAEYLTATSTTAIVGRMLTNLQHSLLRRDPPAAAWVLRLRLRMPGVPAAERAALATLLGTVGRFNEGAGELDSLASELTGDAAQKASRQAAALRA
ncbi:MAG TPA: transglutaminase-like domain-containing protein, partial [Acidimicrobiia bacterium]|nr:transglutaminase-like domain-containing protein [Acidimicrobiia bacterium]